jgi:hypothetical protein
MNDFWLSISIIFATLFGPIIAVRLTRYLDDKAAKRARRAETFRTLMATRSARLSSEHVGALNTVEVDFYGVKAVEIALDSYVNHLNNAPPTGAPEADQKRWFDTQRDLLTLLLSKMAKELGVAKSEIAIRQGGYAPMGWFHKENRKTQAQDWLLKIAAGKEAFPVKIVRDETDQLRQ